MSWEEKLTVDVIVPCYHAAKFIEQCLDTIEKQTLQPNRVILVVDDWEYDNTISIARASTLNKTGQLVIIGRGTKHSPANARNEGIKQSNAKYIAFLDVDDTWEPDKLEYQMAHIGDADVSLTSGVWHRDFGTYTITTTPESFNKHFSNNMFIWSSVVFKAMPLKALSIVRGYVFDENLPQCDDGELLLFLHSTGCYKFTSVEKSLTHIYEHGGNLTQGNLWAPNYWAARIWWMYGYKYNALKHIAFGVIAVVTEWLHIRGYLRERRLKFNGAVRVE